MTDVISMRDLAELRSDAPENRAEQIVYLPWSRKCLCGGGFWKSLLSSDACEDGL